MKLFKLGLILALVVPFLSFSEEEMNDEDKAFVMQFHITACNPVGASVLCYVPYGFLKEDFCPNLEVTFQTQQEAMRKNEELRKEAEELADE